MADSVPIAESRTPGNSRLVLKNALLLIGAQAITTPFAVVVQALVGRYLGPADFGHLYLASTFLGFGFLLVDWGQSGTLPNLVAKTRARAGELLGTGLAWRIVASFVVSALLVLAALALDYGRDFALVLALVAVGLTVTHVSGACQEVVRGFERTDVMAASQVGSQLLLGAATIVTLVLGGLLPTVLVVQACCSLVVLGFVWRATRSAGVGALSVKRETMRELFRGGVPFLFFGFTMALTPNVDAAFMSRLLPDEVIGWHAAARRLVGVLVYPASAIIVALYPTLCRLHAEDRSEFVSTTSRAIRATTVLAVPLALGCGLYPEIGISIFSRDSFGPAEDNLRIMAVFLFFVYFSMPLGCCLLAGGKQKQWSLVLGLAVVFSAVLDPLLIPWFQERMGNGGLGVCVANLASEAFMVAIGIAIAPKGIFDRPLVRQIALALVAGAAMAAVAHLLGRFLNPFLAAPIALASYFGCLWVIGGVDKQQVAGLISAIKRKLSRAR